MTIEHIRRKLTRPAAPKAGSMLLWLVVAGLFAAGCNDPLRHGLDEDEANAMIVALDEHGIRAEKIADPTDAEKWAVEVPRDQRVRAWSTLEQEGLPRPEQGGFDDFYPGGGLIPTADEERVILQYATARELQSSLMRIEGIVDAHVHLVLPEESRVQLGDDEEAEPRASVLVQWQQRLGEPPLDESAVRELISGGVEDLEPDAVRVVMKEVSVPESDGESVELVRVGPLKVAPESQGLLKILVLFMGAVIIVLASGLVLVVLKRRGDGTDRGGRP